MIQHIVSISFYIIQALDVVIFFLFCYSFLQIIRILLFTERCYKVAGVITVTTLLKNALEESFPSFFFLYQLVALLNLLKNV